MAYNSNPGNFERKTVQGTWQCAKCQAPITELPFEPDPQRLNQLLCRDCHRERKMSFRDRR
ncbi:MAG: hypothetical protein Q8L36_01525 [bacterium]|nr:hypothetical protein [bacterium]